MYVGVESTQAAKAKSDPLRVLVLQFQIQHRHLIRCYAQRSRGVRHVTTLKVTTNLMRFWPNRQQTTQINKVPHLDALVDRHGVQPVFMFVDGQIDDRSRMPAKKSSWLAA